MQNKWLILLVLIVIDANADTSIHRCEQDDGTVAFQEMPCPDPATDHNDDSESDIQEFAPTDEFFSFTNPFDEPDSSLQPDEPAPPPLPSQDRSACEKTTRDAIDVLDLEVRKANSKEKRQEYLAELLGLTRQLRECKQL